MSATGISKEIETAGQLEELRQEVRTNAAKAARKNAEVLAAALGQQAKEAIFVQDYGFNMRPYANVLMAKSMAVADAAGEEAAPQLEFQKIKIEHSVIVRFILGL